jgi:hypothetical protein
VASSQKGIRAPVNKSTARIHRAVRRHIADNPDGRGSDLLSAASAVLERIDLVPAESWVIERAATVDGNRFGGDPRAIVLGAHTVTQLDVGADVKPLPFSFPAGL